MHAKMNNAKMLFFYNVLIYIQCHYEWSLKKKTSRISEDKACVFVYNLRVGYAVPYHSFHTQSACHYHVTSGDGWGWTSSWRLWGTGHTCTPSPLYGLSYVGPDFIKRAQNHQWNQYILQVPTVG